MHIEPSVSQKAIISDKLMFIRRAFGAYEVSRDNCNVAIACPKCRSSQKKKLAIRLDDDRLHCWVCGLSGKLINLLVQYRSNLVHEYITKFGTRNIGLVKAEHVATEAILPEGFKLLAQNKHDISVQWALSYLRSRGMSERDLWYFKFGVCSDYTMRRRVIMPSFDQDGNLNFYTGRSVEVDSFRKYMNCIVEKKSIVFNEINIDWSSELTLVEGPFDLVRCNENATCLLGSSLSEDSRLFYQIYKHGTPVLLALDSDMQAKSWQKIARMLDAYNIRVRILDLGGFKDVGEMSHAQFLSARENAVEWHRESALLLKIKKLKS